MRKLLAFVTAVALSLAIAVDALAQAKAPKKQLRRARNWEKKREEQEKKLSAEEYYEEGVVLAKAKKYEQAAEKFKLAIEVKDNFYKAHLGLGEMNFYLARYGDAEKNFNRAAKIEKDELEPRLWLARTYEQQKKWDKAIDFYRKAAAVDGKSYVAKLGLGIAMFENGDLATAEEELKSAAKLDGKPVNAYFYLGKVYEKLKRWDDAVTCFRKVISLETKHYEARLRLGSAYEKLKEYHKAISEYKYLSNSDWVFALDALKRIAELYEAYLDDVENAVLYYERYLKKTTDAQLEDRVKKLKAGEPVPPLKELTEQKEENKPAEPAKAAGGEKPAEGAAPEGEKKEEPQPDGPRPEGS